MQLGRDAEAVDALYQAVHLAEYVLVESDMTTRRFFEERSSVLIEHTSPVYRRELVRYSGDCVEP
jgi:hypothetical protein